MDAPGAVVPAVNLVLAKCGAMAAVTIAENGFVLCPHARPWCTGTTMAYQAGNQRIVFAEIPNHKAFNTRVQAHIYQNTVTGIVSFLFTISKALFGLLPGAVNVDMRGSSVSNCG